MAWADSGQPAPSSHLDRVLHSRLHDARLGHDVGMIVIDAKTGAIISQNSPDEPMQAASNMKLLTATTALATMGPGKRFATRVLKGSAATDLVLQGGGDPLLTRDNLKTLAHRTAKALKHGAHVVVHVDGDLFPKATNAPGWVPHYLGNAVGATQALAVHGDHSQSPSLHASQAFTAYLNKDGVHARLSRNQDAAPDAAVVAAYRGHSVAQSIATMVRMSDSQIAETLFRQVALATGRPPTWEGGQAATVDTLTGLGLDPSAQVIMDGSGLSRLDRLTPRFLASLIAFVSVAQKDRFRALFDHDALPIAGRTGTLTPAYGRYGAAPSKCAAGDVRAKTGTILGTIALSGVAHTVYGGTRIFSIIVNHRPQKYSALATRRAVDGLAATITGCWR